MNPLNYLFEIGFSIASWKLDIFNIKTLHEYSFQNDFLGLKSLFNLSTLMWGNYKALEYWWIFVGYINVFFFFLFFYLWRRSIRWNMLFNCFAKCNNSFSPKIPYYWFYFCAWKATFRYSFSLRLQIYNIWRKTALS